MKIFTFIMAFIVIALSCMPCADAGAVQVAAKMEVKKSHTPEKNHNDACTPFCQCACCAGFSINHFIAKISSPHIIQSSEYSSEFLSSTFTISLPIWQPPQLV
jgi:hypothetical protein